MAANTIPIWGKTPQIEWGSTDGNGGGNGALKTANTAKDGTGTVLTAFTADATNGSYIQRLRIRSAGGNVATVLRVFINNGSANSTAANNVLFDEITLPTTVLSEVAALPVFEVPMNLALPAGYKVNVTVGTTLAAGVFVSGVGAKY